LQHVVSVFAHREKYIGSPFGGPQLRLAASSPAWKDALAEADDGIDNYRGGIDVGRHCQPQHLGHPDIE
jgi:hypothetical protein